MFGVAAVGRASPASPPRERVRAAAPAARAHRRRVRGDRRRLGREPNRAELAMYSVMWSEHCSYKSSQDPPARPAHRGSPVLVGPGQDAGVVDVGRRHRVRVQDGVALAPVGDRAVPGRRDRGRRDRARRALDGGPTGRAAGPAAVRPARRGAEPVAVRAAWWPGSAATATASACRPSAARCGSRECHSGEPDRERDVRRRSRRPSGSSASDREVHEGVAARPVRRGDRSRRHRRGVGAGVAARSRTAPRNAGRACRSATRSLEKLLIEACARAVERGLLEGLKDLGGAGLTCAVSESAARRRARRRPRPRRGPAPRARHGGVRDPDVRVAGADARDRAPRSARATFGRSASGGGSRPR